MTSTEADLQLALQKKKGESVELRTELNQAASVGQKLMEENERLSKLVQDRVLLGAADGNGQVRKAPSEASSEALWSELDSEMDEQSKLQDQYQQLQDAYATLAQKIDEEQSARQRAEAAAARAKQDLTVSGRRSQGQPKMCVAAEELREIEQKVHASFGSGYQEQLDSLRRKREASRAEVEKLRGELQAQSQRLDSAQEEVINMKLEVQINANQLAMAESAERERQRSEEVERERKIARRMRRMQTAATTGSKTENLSLDSAQLDTVTPIVDELNDAQTTGKLDDLQSENEELLAEILALRSQLEEMQAVQATELVVVGSSSGDGAARDDHKAAFSDLRDDNEKAAHVIEALQEQLRKTQNEARDANERLAQYRDLYTAQAVGDEEEDSPSLWARFVGTFATYMCTGSRRAKPQNNSPNLILQRTPA